MKNVVFFGFAESAEKRRWLDAGVRGMLAVFGAYGLGVLGAITLVKGLSLDSVLDATALSIMLAFILEAGAILWVFAAATLVRAVAGLFVPAVLLGAWLAATRYAL